MVELALIGGLFGAAGQAIRECLRLAQMRRVPASTFKMSGLITNLLIGFIAGSLGISVLANSAAYKITQRDIFTLLILGYTVGDFIERIMKVLLLQTDRTDRTPEPSTNSLGKTEGNGRN